VTARSSDEDRLRAAAFAHLDRLRERHPDGALPSAEINSFSFDGRPLRLIVQTGIWKPAGLTSALSIRTTYTPPTAARPYEDDIGDDGLVRYKYRGMDPEHSDNRALREAMRQQEPLVYFVGVASGIYTAHYPVWIVAEESARQEFSVAVDEAQRWMANVDLTWPERRYSLELTKRRLHQQDFRTLVLRAYQSTCAMCDLRHGELLDAAHILRDGHPQGQPVIQNGLALCKIHHAAYDANILGVRPDLVIDVQPRILAEIDGPMLRYGLQELAGHKLTVPRARREQPDQDRLAERYDEFAKAG
jgi:putative restriction endonuclease